MSANLSSFAIMGSGGVGGYYGACLARAGHPVTFIARGAHLQAIQEKGLSIEGPDESFHLEVNATDDPGEVGVVDVILFCVKLWDTVEAAHLCEAMMGPQSMVLTLQNGVDSEQALAGILGKERVLGGVAEISSAIDGPGCIRKVSPFHRIRLGEMDGSDSLRTARLAEQLTAAGIETDRSLNIRRALWVKFILLAGVSSLTALTRRPIGEVRADPDVRELLQSVLAETFEVAVASGVELRDDTVAERLGFIDRLPAGMIASMALDLEQGRRLELPWLAGAVVRMGEALDVPTPANRFIVQALKLHARGENA